MKTILQGSKHQDIIRERMENRPKRLPVTESMMKLIKQSWKPGIRRWRPKSQDSRTENLDCKENTRSESF